MLSATISNEKVKILKITWKLVFNTLVVVYLHNCMIILASKKLKAWKNTEACVRPFFPAAAVNSLKGKY